MRTSTCDVLIVGAGAAGMMSAITAAERGCRVVVLEKNDRPGRKLYITGKGRCNVTNDCDVPECLANICTNPKFLHAALRAFPPQAVMAFFEDLGCPLKVERGRRVYPQSDRAADVIDALCAKMRALGVTVRQAAAKELLLCDGAVCGVRTDRGDLEASRVIVATGGASYPRTGSTGDGYALAQAVGHTVVPPTGSLVPLISDAPVCRAAAGLELRNVRLTLCRADGKTVYEEQGEAWLTDFGLDGPLTLSASANMGREEGFTAYLDLKPALDRETLDARVLRDLRQYQNSPMTAALTQLLPRALIAPVLAQAGIAQETAANALTREARRRLVETVKKLPIPIRGKRPLEEAIVTSGGVAVTEVDPKTMGSKLVKGLYFAGELLDLDAYTGGFNLQIAWATGRSAGLAASRAESEETK